MCEIGQKRMRDFILTLWLHRGELMNLTFVDQLRKSLAIDKIQAHFKKGMPDIRDTMPIIGSQSALRRIYFIR